MWIWSKNLYSTINLSHFKTPSNRCGTPPQNDWPRKLTVYTSKKKDHLLKMFNCFYKSKNLRGKLWLRYPRSTKLNFEQYMSYFEQFDLRKMKNLKIKIFRTFIRVVHKIKIIVNPESQSKFTCSQEKRKVNLLSKISLFAPFHSAQNLQIFFYLNFSIQRTTLTDCCFHVEVREAQVQIEIAFVAHLRCFSYW